MLPYLAILPLAIVSQSGNSGVKEAREVIRRFIGARAEQIELRLVPSQSGKDRFTYAVRHGHLTIKGTSPVALSSGFYQYVKRNGWGMKTWAGQRLTLPRELPDCPSSSCESPFKFRQYFNVVTYGYTMPFWDWTRWEQELDWMALHGINMPLALVGTEAIGTRVWRSLGLSQAEIDAFYTGPAYLPWQRMGNLTRHDGPLNDSWHADQVALQHRILDRMRRLGMTPIVPGFSGFVPSGIRRLHPNEKLAEFAWGGFATDKKSQFLDPKSNLFADISQRFLAEWSREFGYEPYRLIDSFNEMELPAVGQARELFLTDYGRRIYSILQSNDPRNTWVIQGWMLGYQRDIWTPQTVRALFAGVPTGKAMILDMACDYNGVFWQNGMNWRLFDAYQGQPWIYGVIPNMGGKTAYTGVMSFYAKDLFTALDDPKHGNLVGYGMSPEGIENNEALYELMADNIWRHQPVNVHAWVQDYCRSRYGSAPTAALEGWNRIRESAYGTFTDHPRFGWQYGRPSIGSVNKDPKFEQGVKLLATCSDTLQSSPLYQADLFEQTAMVLGSRAEDRFHQAEAALKDHRRKDCVALWKSAEGLLLAADRLLESHPNYRLARWIKFARSHGKGSDMADRYESDARRIVSVWGPPVNDYSARIWSGLIRDFYVPRMELRLKELFGTPEDIPGFEDQWVRTRGLSKIEPFSNPVQAAVHLLDGLQP